MGTKSLEEIGAGDQGIMFGYATDESEAYEEYKGKFMPMTLMVGRRASWNAVDLQREMKARNESAWFIFLLLKFYIKVISCLVSQVCFPHILLVPLHLAGQLHRLPPDGGAQERHVPVGAPRWQDAGHHRVQERGGGLYKLRIQLTHSFAVDPQLETARFPTWSLPLDPSRKPGF
jgi:hypothetical protein